MKKMILGLCLLLPFDVLAQETITMPSSFNENQMIEKKMDSRGNFVPVDQTATAGVPSAPKQSVQNFGSAGAGNAKVQLPPEIIARQKEAQTIQTKAAEAAAARQKANATNIARPTTAGGVPAFVSGKVNIPNAKTGARFVPASASGATFTPTTTKNVEPEAVPTTVAPLSSAPIRADGSAGLAPEQPTVVKEEAPVGQEKKMKKMRAIVKQYGLPGTTFTDTVQQIQMPTTNTFQQETMPSAMESFRRESVRFEECRDGDKNCQDYEVDEKGEVILK